MRQLFALMIGTILMVLAAMFSLVIFALLAVFGVAFFLWFWWKTRALRKVLREQQARQAPTEGVPAAYREGSVFDGEAVVVEEEIEPNRRLTSADLPTQPDPTDPPLRPE